MSAIDIQQLYFNFANKQILDDINIHFSSQHFSVLLGRNGSGKSTLFHLMAGIYPLQQGQILLNHQPLQQLKGKQRAESLGFLTQTHQSVFNFKVIDVVMTGRAAFSKLLPQAKDREYAEQALETLGITHLYHRDYTTLSGGERQLVMIARILTQNPKVILLDEPTNHLDVHYQSDLMEKLQRLCQQGYTIISIMHDPNLAFLYADDFYFLQNQRIIQPESRTQATDPDFLKHIYDIEFDQAYTDSHRFVMPKRLY